MMARKQRLYRGDVLEVILDDEGNKGYIVLLDMHKTRKKVPLFGLLAVEPRQQGYRLEDLNSLSYVSQLMAFVDPQWPKIGRLILPDEFIWPDLYEVSTLTHKGKIFVYKYGESEPYKELNEGDDLEGAQPKSVCLSGALLFLYRKALREHGLYNKPEPSKETPVPITETEEMSFSGLYGDVWSYYRAKINDKKKDVALATKATIKKFSDELNCSDTALQLYMGIVKAQLEFNNVVPEIKDEVLKRIEEEKSYLANEKWLSNQANKIKEELLKIRTEQ